MSIRVWADVGGTFTDVIAVGDFANGRQSIKVLSSGILRGRLEVSPDGSRRLSFPRGSLGPNSTAPNSTAPNSTAPKFAPPTSTTLPDDFFRGAILQQVDSNGETNQLGTIGSFNVKTGEFHLLADIDQSSLPDAVVEINCQLEAPVLATRLLLGIPIHRELPPISVRLGTTRGTNALLTRTGARVAFVTTRGFGDLLQIRDQDRRDLFDLNVKKDTPLTNQVIEAHERIDARGNVLQPLEESVLRRQLQVARDSGAQSLAICLMNGFVNERHECQIERVAREIGFRQISRSSHVAPLIKLVARSETTVLDAYLNPILNAYVTQLAEQFGSDCHLRLMTSGGNLVTPSAFRGRDSILSGPAGGVVALADLSDRHSDRQANVSEAIGHRGAIGLDMGGTSTDVSRYDGQIGRRFESRVAGVRVMTPMMDIHTVAAGGGSICDLADGRLIVGPESAGADPGPACYGRGGPLAVTDINLILGRIRSERFPFPLHEDNARRRLNQIAQTMTKPLSDEALAEGFLDIAVTHMSEAVTAITTASGIDARNLTLVGFGGAAPQHVCRVADALQIKRILDPPDASVMSAIGMGLANIGRVVTRGVYQSLDTISDRVLEGWKRELRKSGENEIASESIAGATLSFRFECECRYVGTDSSLTVECRTLDEIKRHFESEHGRVFGYQRSDRSIDLVSIRCEITSPPDPIDWNIPNSSQSATPKSTTNFWFRDRWVAADVIDRESLAPGDTIRPSTMVDNGQSTLIVEPNWQGRVRYDGSIELQPVDDLPSGEIKELKSISASSLAGDPVLLEVIARRIQGIADSMGEVLRRTAVSVNVKERLDFSCAVFRGDGALIANAPHVPVHLGAMGATVRAIQKAFPVMSPGDCYVSNDPFSGGSHLPDVTVVTPVFCDDESNNGTPHFFVASRAHHAEIGGVTPGSMPPDATSLAEEGVLIRNFALQRHNRSFDEQLRDLLSSGEYPSRNPDENLADITAQRAAGRAGVESLQRLADEYSVPIITELMGRLLDVAGDSVERVIRELPRRKISFQDSHDDGTIIAATIHHQKQRLVIDFAGTAGVHTHGLNATPSITRAAVLYVLRCLCDSNLPLCDGVLRDVDLKIPIGLLNPPANNDPRECAAVVAGNVETSQRIVDVLLGAFGQALTDRAVAASQGTMNNLLIGDESFGYYETIGGGAGATNLGDGASAVHTHMTNTRITDPEVLESRLPLRLVRFLVRRDSGGNGRHRGGDGMIREIEFLKPLSLTMITNRRTTKPYGVCGGQNGVPGRNILVKSVEQKEMPAAFACRVETGDRLIIETPGGGGWGSIS